MRKHYKHRKKYRRNNIDITQECLYKKPAKEEIEIKPTLTQPEQKIGFWKAIGLIVKNKEPQNGNQTATFFAEVMTILFNTVAIGGALLFLGTILASIFALDWNVGIPRLIIQIIAIVLLLGISFAISLIFRIIANEIKAEKDRNYITTLFFGFTSVASLIVALVALFKGVG